MELESLTYEGIYSGAFTGQINKAWSRVVEFFVMSVSYRVQKLKRVVGWLIRSTNKMQLVIEFIIPKFIEGSTCFERHTAHHQEL